MKCIDNASGRRWDYARWSKTASNEQIKIIFQRLLKEHRPKQVLNYLWIFIERELPRLDDRLFDFLESDDYKIAYSAARALSHTTHELIHDLAIKLLKKGILDIQFAIMLLKNNYNLSDFHVIFEAIKLASVDVIHAVGRSIIDLCELQSDPELAKLLLWVYEKTPCSMCRNKAVDLLFKRKAMPSALLHESLFDCYPGTQALARAAIESETQQ